MSGTRRLGVEQPFCPRLVPPKIEAFVFCSPYEYQVARQEAWQPCNFESVWTVWASKNNAKSGLWLMG